MAKSKYNSERIAKIIDAIFVNGSDRAGWTGGGISEDTFYQWMKKYPEFSEGVAIAKQDYRNNCPETLKRQAQKAFADYLFGRVEETWTSTEVISDGDRQIVKETVKRVRRGPPQWAIERVLGPELNRLISILRGYGLDVVDTYTPLNNPKSLNSDITDMADASNHKFELLN